MIIFGFFSALVLTITIEAIVSTPFHTDKRIIIVINLITNPILNLFISIFNLLSGHIINLFVLLVLELLIVIVEGVIIFSLSKNQKLQKTFLISFLINLASFLIGTPIINIIF